MNRSISRAPRKSGSNPSLCGGSPSNLMRCRLCNRVADFHASIAQHFDIDHSVADLKLSVATTNLDLQIAEKAAGATISIGWNLQNRLSTESGVIWVFELDAAPHLVHDLSLPYTLNSRAADTSAKIQPG